MRSQADAPPPKPHPLPSATLPSLVARLRFLPRPVWFLFFGVFLNKFGSFVVPFLALYMTRQGCSTLEAGIAIGAYGAGHLLASFLGGYLADVLGRKPTIILSMLAAALSMLLLSQARGFETIVLLTALAGLSSELYRPASSALLTDLVPPEHRVTAFATYRLAFNAGWAFGPATAGFLAKYSFFWLFVGDAATSLLFCIVAWFTLPEGLRRKHTENGWGDAWHAISTDLKFLQILASSVVIALVFFQIASTYCLHLTQLGFSPAVYGLLISLNGAVVVLFELPLTLVTSRFPAPKVIATGHLLIGFGFAANAFATSIAGLIPPMLILTIGEMISMPVGAAYIANLAPPHLRGRYMGCYGLTWASALAVGPALGMSLLGSGAATLWCGSAILGVIAALIILPTPSRTASSSADRSAPTPTGASLPPSPDPSAPSGIARNGFSS